LRKGLRIKLCNSLPTQWFIAVDLGMGAANELIEIDCNPLVWEIALSNR